MSIHFHVLLHIWEHLLCICLRSRRLWGTTFSVFWYNFAFMGFPCGSIFYACVACVATLGHHLICIFNWFCIHGATYSMHHLCAQSPWGRRFYAFVVCAVPCLYASFACPELLGQLLWWLVVFGPVVLVVPMVPMVHSGSHGSYGSYASFGLWLFPWLFPPVKLTVVPMLPLVPMVPLVPMAVPIAIPLAVPMVWLIVWRYWATQPAAFCSMFMIH